MSTSDGIWDEYMKELSKVVLYWKVAKTTRQKNLKAKLVGVGVEIVLLNSCKGPDHQCQFGFLA